MKLLIKNSTVFMLAVIAIAACAFAVFDFDDAERRYCEAGVYDLLNDNLIDMYESEIAGERIVSDKSASQLKRTADRLGISAEKLKAIMLLQDLAGKTGRNASLSELAQMGDLKLLGYFKQCAKEYLATLPEERRAELEQKFKSAIK